MNFGRAKTILIYIFLFVNIFLLVVYNLFYEKQNTVNPDTAIDLLNKNNITVERSLIENFSSKLEGVEIDNLAVNEEKIASLFLGKPYTSPRAHYYTKEGETLEIIDLSVDYKILNPKDKAYKDANSLNIGNKVLKTLLKKGIGNSVLEVANISDNKNGSFFVTLMYKYNDYPVFNNNLHATAGLTGLTSVKGTVVSFKKLKDVEYSITPTANILLELLSNGDLKSEFPEAKVTSVRLGYYLPLGKTEASIYAIPAYEIEINSKKVYFYDAREKITSDAVLLGSKNITK